MCQPSKKLYIKQKKEKGDKVTDIASLKSAIESISQSFSENISKNINIEASENVIKKVIELIDCGELRVCSQELGKWKVHSWVKQAILLYFQLLQSQQISSGAFTYFDTIPVKQWTGKEGVRVVPPATVRKGSFVASGTVLMPSYINIGAYVDSGAMIDTWATVGSCAQVGKNVHISGGVGLGGVLEPVQAQPVIVEDNAFLGSRCIVVEGVRVEQGAVLGAGVVLTASTKIIDTTSKEEKIHKGIVPKNSVVIPGQRVKKFPAGDYSIPCALIIGKRSASTDLKISLNEALRQVPH